MGFSLSSSLGIAKTNRKLFGKKASKWGEWGYWKKKSGLNKLFKSPSSAKSSANFSDASSFYGPTGSIVGRY